MERPLPYKVLVPLVLGIALSVAVLVFSELGYRRLESANREMSASLATQRTLNEILALVVDAETAQRGFLLTERSEYLQPYRAAVPKVERRLQALATLVRGDTPEQRDRGARLGNLVGKKLAEVESTLKLFESGNREAALELFKSDLGRRTMDEIRAEINALSMGGGDRLSDGAWNWERDITQARAGMLLMGGSTIALLLVVWLLARREIVLRERTRAALEAEQCRLEQTVDERTAELSELSSHLQTVREEERSKLARDIHDELGSILVSAKMDVSRVQERLAGNDAEAAGKLQRALAMLDEGVQVKRRIVEELRPTLLDNLGLGPALQWLASETCARAGLECAVSVPEDENGLPAAVSIALFRVAQEALTNVVRHANAKRVSIELLHEGETVTLHIADDGVGIGDGAARNRLSHGIRGMRQRVRALGGEFALRGSSGLGTTLEIRVPLPQASAPAGEDEQSTAA